MFKLVIMFYVLFDLVTKLKLVVHNVLMRIYNYTYCCIIYHLFVVIFYIFFHYIYFTIEYYCSEYIILALLSYFVACFTSSSNIYHMTIFNIFYSHDYFSPANASFWWYKQGGMGFVTPQHFNFWL